MHSTNQNEFLFQHVITTSNVLVCRLRENRIRLKESLTIGKLAKESINKKFQETDAGTVYMPAGTCTNESKCSWKYRDVDDTQNMKTTKNSLDCPNCLTKLGINVRSSSHIRLENLTDQLKALIIPNESGDKSEDDDTCNQIVNCSCYLRSGTSPNPNMPSYTVLKGCTSSPDSTQYVRGKNSPIIKSRSHNSHKSQLGKKHIGACCKSCPSHACHRRRDQNHQLVRSQSFTLAPFLHLRDNEATNNYSRISLRVIDSSIHTRESIALNRTRTCLSPSQIPSDQQLQSEESFTYDNILIQDEDFFLGGIDKVDAPATLYDSASSSTTSCEYNAKSETNLEGVEGKYSVSRSAPNTKLRKTRQTNVGSSAIYLPDAPTSAVYNTDHQTSTTALYNSFSENADFADHQTLMIHSPRKEVHYVDHQTSTTTLSPNGNKIDHNQSVPNCRQDLYKDCFTLLLEKWFG